MEYSLRGSVGAKADNFADDVFVVQTLLGIVMTAEGRVAPWLLTMGQDSPELRSEIASFQRKNTPHRDGKIDRGGSTWKALLAKAKKILGGILPPLPPSPPGPNPQPGPNPSTGKLLKPIGPQDWKMWSPPGPLLSNPSAIRTKWDIDFHGVPHRGMNGEAFLTPSNFKVRCLGVAVPKACALPKAYVIYFRHTAKPGDYPNLDSMIKFGIGDHMIGRTQLLNQVSASGKDVAVVLPMGVGGLHEFTNDEGFITQCLQEIDESIRGTQRTLPPIAVACYSDGIGELSKFLANCPNLKSKIVAGYDMDGALVSRFRGESLNISGAQIFRYVGGGAPARRPKETDDAYLARTMSGQPTFIPLPKIRWKSHPNYREDKGGEMWWLHHYIPSCMLQHGLAMTSSF